MLNRLVVAAILLAGASTVAVSAEHELLREGRAVLDANCGGCHALGAEAASPNPDAPPFHEVLRRYPAADLQESLGEGIVTGHPDMPEVTLEPDQIAAVIAYLDAVAVVMGLEP
jgi:mono/diheme cytochrome c family protein